MAGKHEEVRLGEPPNGASEVRAVDGKDLEFLIINVPDPARDIAGFAIPGIDHGIAISGETSLAGRKLFQRAESEPRVITRLLFANHGRKQITNDRHG